MINLSNISMTFPNGNVGLHTLSLDFMSGQFTVLLGQSGAGKSTLLRCLNYLNKPTEGVIAVDGLGSLSERKVLREHRRRSAMIFQQHQLIGRYTAFRNVLTARVANHGPLRGLLPLPKAEQVLALVCLERVGLIDKAFDRVDNLSGGQKQRVGIARALAQQPRIILADEPVASLDPGTADSILSLLHSICKEDDIPAIVSLHQIELARKYADRIVALCDGRVIFDGAPHELEHNALREIYRCETLAA